MEGRPILIDEDDRYARLRLISWWDQQRLASARVLVVGAGALGNEVLKNLALLGVGTIHIVDFDRVELSNLSRSVLFRSRDRGRSKALAAAEAVRDLNPDVHVYPRHGNIMTDVGLGLFRDVAVVIGCLDNREARLWVNRQCWKVGTPWIDGGIQELNGVVKVFAPPDGACYECGMTENDYRLINLRYSCPLLRREDLEAGKVPTAPTVSAIIGGLQVQEAVKLIHGMPAAAGEAMVFNGDANRFYRTAFQRREECLSHETYPSPVKLPLSSRRHTATDLFAQVREKTGAHGPLRLLLDRDLVLSLDCVPCGSSRPAMQALYSMRLKQSCCPQCGQPAKPRLEHVIEEDGPWAKETLTRLGIPPYDIVRVQTAQQEQVFLLDADDPNETS